MASRKHELRRRESSRQSSRSSRRSGGMRLTVGPNTLSVPDPTDTQIVARLEDLTEDGNSFTILGTDDQTYIQTAITPRGFVVEYREGSKDTHHESTLTHDIETVKNLFLLYRKQDPAYKSAIQYRQWQPGWRPVSRSLFDVRIRDPTVWGWFVALLYLIVVLGVCVPGVYRIGRELIPTIQGDEWLIALLLVPFLLALIIVMFSATEALAKRFGISLFRQKKGNKPG